MRKFYPFSKLARIGVGLKMISINVIIKNILKSEVTNMSKKILIPTPLRPFVNQQEVVETQASNVNDALKDLVLNFPKLEQHLYDGNGNLRKFINIYVNDSDIRDQDGVNTNLTDSDEVSLVPAIAGGVA